MIAIPKTIGRPTSNPAAADHVWSLSRPTATRLTARRRTKFSHHDRGIHDEPEVQRAEAHEIRRQAETLIARTANSATAVTRP